MEYLVVLIAAIFHALWNGFMKKSEDKLVSMAFIRTVGLLYGIIAVLVSPPLDVQALPWVFLAAGMHFLYFYALTTGYSLGDFSLVYPVSRGLSPLLILLFSLMFLDGELTMASFTGTVVIGVAILLVAAGEKQLDKKPLIFAVLTAFTIAGYTLASGIGIRKSVSFFSFSGMLEVLMSSGLILFTIVKRRKNLVNTIKRQYKIGIGSGLLSVSAYAVALWAMSSSSIAAVSALRETSVLFASLFGVILLKERFSIVRFFASVLFVFGIISITLL